MKVTALLVFSVLAAFPPMGYAHGDAKGSKGSGVVKKEQTAWGIAGDRAVVKQTIEVRMLDKMRYEPDLVQVKVGETVRFVMKNTGKIMHEFVIGTKEVLSEHAAVMTKFPNMEHEEPYMAHVAPGKTGEIVWNFNRVGEFDFACLIPGHYQSGMVGKIKVTPR